MAGNRGSMGSNALTLGARAILRFLGDVPDGRLMYDRTLAEWILVLPQPVGPDRVWTYEKSCGDQLVEGGYVEPDGEGRYRLAR